MGGNADQSGYVSKQRLIEVIQAEFELTIDMVEFLKTIGGDSDEMSYYEFCIMLDHGTGIVIGETVRATAPCVCSNAPLSSSLNLLFAL